MIEILRSGGTIVIEEPCSDEVHVMSSKEVIDVMSYVATGFSAGEYDGPYTVTPTEETQVLQMNGMVATADVTIEPIPNNYGLITYDGVGITVS